MNRDELRAKPENYEGCIFDASQRGRQIDEAIQDLALEMGWPGPKAELDAEDGGASDAALEAENWLNDNTAPPGWAFGLSEDGSFLFLPNEKWDEVDNDLDPDEEL